MSKPLVSIVMGSDSDLVVMEEAAKVLGDFGIPFEITISSAHRTPANTLELARGARRRGIKVIIAGAGLAAHLAGFIASETTLPVIGVPMEAGPLKGLDALLSTVQMPGGVPVASMAIGKAGAKNAGVFAAEIIGLSDASVGTKLTRYKKKLAAMVEEKNKALSKS